MTIRGGGNPHSAMAPMPLREWTRRLGALPAEAYDCFMVGTPYGFNRIQAWFARLIAANGRLPSDHRAANHPIAEEAPSLTAAARDGDGNMRSGRKNARGAGRTKEWNAKDDQNGVTSPLDNESPIQAVCGKTARTVRREGRPKAFPTPIVERFIPQLFRRRL